MRQYAKDMQMQDLNTDSYNSIVIATQCEETVIKF